MFTDIHLVLPEIILVVMAMLLLMFGVFQSNEESPLVSFLAMLTLVGVAIAVILQANVPAKGFNHSFEVDAFTRFMKVLVLIGSAVAIFMSRDYLKDARLKNFEFPVLVLLATTGMMTMISANDLMVLYLGLELQSLSLYVLATFHRNSIRSSEAGLKYFVLGALSSGMLLYGASLVYGMTGTTNFDSIASALDGRPSIGLIIGLVFMLSGLAFKISAAPFHMWTPDVYEGAPTPVTALFAGAPKVAAMALIMRLVWEAFPSIKDQWQQIIVFMSMVSMILGAFAAIGQNNIKRLLAYSSIGHMGFALVGLAAANQSGVEGILIYMAIYLITTLGSFAFVLSMRREEVMVEDINELAGFAQNNLLGAFLFAMLLFSLAGIPPLVGFFAKYFVFVSVIESAQAGQTGLYIFAVLGILSSVVGAFYYLRLVKIMFFDEPAEKFDPMPYRQKLVLIISGLMVMALTFYPGPVIAAAKTAAKSFF